MGRSAAIDGGKQLTLSTYSIVSLQETRGGAAGDQTQVQQVAQLSVQLLERYVPALQQKMVSW